MERNVSHMGLKEKLAAIEKLKAEGSVSDSQYANLLKIALEEVENVPDQKQADAPDLPPRVVENSAAQRKLPEGALKIIAATVAAFVVVFVGIRVFGSSDPIESKEYKELLSKKSDLVSKKSELNAQKSQLESQLGAFEGNQVAIEDYERRIKKWNDVISAIGSIG